MNLNDLANIGQVIGAVAVDPVLSQIAAKGLRDYTSLSEQERIRFIAAFMSFLSYSQNAFLKWRQKLLAPDLWLAGLGVCHHESSLRAGWQGLLERSRLYVWRGIPPLRRETI
jgi:hypothetical protein